MKRPRAPQTGRREQERPAYVRVSDTLVCRFYDNAWHLVTVKPLPDPLYHARRCRDVDVVLNQPVSAITAEQARQHYGAAVYAVAARRLTRRELRQHPIPNEFWA